MDVKCPQRPTHQRLRLHGGAISRWCNLWLELSRVSLDHSRTASEGTVRAWSLPFLLLPGHKASHSLCQAFFPYLSIRQTSSGIKAMSPHLNLFSYKLIMPGRFENRNRKLTKKLASRKGFTDQHEHVPWGSLWQGHH